MDTNDALRHVPLFRFMDDEERAGIQALMETRTYEAGQVILLEGEAGEEFSIVLEGMVIFQLPDASGRELTVDEVEPGGFFGELSLLTGQPRGARIQAIDKVTTLVLGRDEFLTYLQQHPPAAIDVLQVLGERIHRTDKLLRSSVSRNVNELIDDKLSLGERIADVIADFSGSIPFLVINALIFGVWIGWNQPWAGSWQFDPYPFGLLTMIVSLEAIFLSIFLLISSNRQAAKDRLAAEIDHEVNTKAEVEVGRLLQRVDELERRLHDHHSEQRTLFHQQHAQIISLMARYDGKILHEENDRSTNASDQI